MNFDKSFNSYIIEKANGQSLILDDSAFCKNIIKHVIEFNRQRGVLTEVTFSTIKGLI